MLLSNHRYRTCDESWRWYGEVGCLCIYSYTLEYIADHTLKTWLEQTVETWRRHQAWEISEATFKTVSIASTALNVGKMVFAGGGKIASKLGGEALSSGFGYGGGKWLEKQGWERESVRTTKFSWTYNYTKLGTRKVEGSLDTTHHKIVPKSECRDKANGQIF